MALSQIQCLDDNHVNPRTHEAKPEFLYCEEQRLALEILLRDGKEAFFKQLEDRGVRGFLSDLELAALSTAVEPYDPGAKLYREDPEDEHNPLSLHYWPDMSDMSTPELDMGWPDSEGYRGVTRTTVHTQPPLEGQAHIKEVIRKMIAQAQKVIAVVMDIFTDADIFRDLLDASFKRKVSVYILLERTYIPHFLSMCQRASMHVGHLKNLRVRCCGGTDFLTHSCTKIRGHMGHRFMFIDGDKAASGSYSFTWMSSRLDRNLITVVTGQGVDTFDRLFRFLYTSSKLVDLRSVATEPEPEPDPVVKPTTMALPSAAVARKLYNPKYALVAVGNASLSPSSSAGNNSPKESQKDTKNEEATKKGRRRQSKDTGQEAPPLHPGLVDLEKAYLFDYLPTWPEPDPPSDVIGFINIRDNTKPLPVHLQRSEMFEVSQAIRFSSPFSKPKETLPEITKPRNFTVDRHEENPPQQKQSTEAITRNLTATKSDKENTTSAEKEPSAVKTYTSTAKLSPCEPQQSAPMATMQTVSASSPKTEAKTDTPTSVNSKSALQNRNSLERNQTTKALTSMDSDSQLKIQNFIGNTSSAGNIPNNVSSTPVSANYQVSPAIAVPSTLTSASPIEPSNAISTSVSKPTADSPIATTPVASPPVPKPRTVQLVIRDGASNGQKMPEVSIVKKVDSKAKVTAEDNVPLVVTLLAQKESETVPELANKSASKSILQKSAEDTAAKDCSQQRESKKSHEEQAGDKGELQPVADNKITAPTKDQVSQAAVEARLNIHKEKNEPTHLPKGIIIRKSDILEDKPIEIPLKTVANAHNSSNQEWTYQAKAGVPQRINYSSSDENVNSLNTLIDMSPILQPKQNVDQPNSPISSSTIIKLNQNLDPPSLPIDNSAISKPKLSLDSLSSPTDIVKRKLDLPDSPIDKALILNTKQHLDLPYSPIERSPILNRKQILESENSLIDNFPISIQKQNLGSPNSPTARSPTVKKDLDPLKSLIDSSPILKWKQHKESLNLTNDKSPILKPKQNQDSLNSPTDRSPIVKAQHNLDPPNPLLESSPTSKRKQNIDLQKSPIVKRKQNQDSLTSLIDRSPIVKAKPNSSLDISPNSKRKQNMESVNPPSERILMVKPKENQDTLNSSNNRFQDLNPKPKLDLQSSPIDSSPVLKRKQNVESLNLPSEKSLIIKTKQNIDSPNTPNDRSPILKRKQNLDLLNPATDSSLIRTPNHNLDEVKPLIGSSTISMQKHNLDPPNSPIDSSQIIKPRQKLDSPNSQTDNFQIVKPGQKLDSPNSPIDSSQVIKPKQNDDLQNSSPTSKCKSNVESLNSPIERSLIEKTRQNLESTNNPFGNSVILNPKHDFDPLNSSVESSPIVKPKHSPIVRSPILKQKQSLQSINSSVDNSLILKPKRSEIMAPIAVDTQPTDIFTNSNKGVPQSAKQNRHNPPQSPRELPEKPMRLHLNIAQIPDLTPPEKDSRTLLTQRHSPILDGFPTRVPTPDSRRSRTPDFRTPTSDFSDGYGSTTSDEYFECCESPFSDSKDQVPFYSLNAKEDSEIHIRSSCGSYKVEAGRLSTDNTLSSCETLNLSTKGSLSSIVEKLADEEALANDSSKELERPEGNLEWQAAQNNNQSLSKSIKAAPQSAVAEQSLTPRLNNEATEAKRTPARDMKPKRVYSRADRMAAGGEKTALSAVGVERRETVPTANKEPEGHKFSVPPTPVI